VVLHNNLHEAIEIHRSRLENSLIAFLDYFYSSNSIHLNAIRDQVAKKIGIIDDDYEHLLKDIENSKTAA
jgi:hypothetical protein